MHSLYVKIRQSRRGSALVTVMFVAVITAIALGSLLTFAMDRRRETARLVMYNAELAEAEMALDRIISMSFFVGQNQPRQYSGDLEAIENFLTTAINADIDQNIDFELAMLQTRDPADGPLTITQTEVNNLGVELQPWLGYTLDVESYIVAARALAGSGSGFAYAGEWTRPGVSVSRTITYFAIPLLNYAIFYENLFELDGGARIDVYGKVHTNEDWYLTSSSSVGYHGTATVAGRFFGGIYNPLDGDRRGWWSGSDRIDVADTRNAGLAPDAAATSLTRIRDTTNIGVNRGYLSSYIYNPSNPTSGNPVFNSSTWDSVTGPDSEWQPNPDWVDLSRAMFNGFLRDSAHGVEEVRLPIGEQESPRLLIEEPGKRSTIDAAGNVTWTDTDETRPALDKAAVNLGYQASVVFEVAGIESAGQNADLISDPGATVEVYRWVPSVDAVTGEVTYSKEPLRTPQILDEFGNPDPSADPVLTKKRIWNGREEKYVHLVELDMGGLTDYFRHKRENPSNYPSLLPGQAEFDLTNPYTAPDGTAIDDGIIYVQNSIDNVADPTSSQPGVVITEAEDFRELEYEAGGANFKGFTIATNAPLYTHGNVNSEYDGDSDGRIPLMLAGDSINVLSGAFSWSDYFSSSGNGPRNDSTDTETNAVFVSGNVPTKLNQYGGGGENYFRYLERWSGETHLYRGSMLNLWESVIATEEWDKNSGRGVNAGYYGAPRRDWGWDVAYAAGAAPPGIPTSRQIAIGRWDLISSGEFDMIVGGTAP